MTFLPFPSRHKYIPLILLLAAGSAALAQSAPPPPDQKGPLNIHVTAVRGGAQFRPDDKSKWQDLKVGSDFVEGVEFRTGPRGTIQFTVGTDQVFRVDRLSVVKMLRANLSDDGTIRTDLGMTYGRVSKDVDSPREVHQDTIVCPSSTLAVRGTHVSMYDSPPFDPEARSLTGAALLRNIHGLLVPFGSKGGGDATIVGNASGAAFSALPGTTVDGNGAFAGNPPAGPGGNNGQPPPPPPPQIPPTVLPKPPSQTIGGMQNTMQAMNSMSVPVTGSLVFQLNWFSPTPQTQVLFGVIPPNGNFTITGTVDGFVPQPNGTGVIVGSSVASPSPDGNGNYDGQVSITYGDQAAVKFDSGHYIIAELFTGQANLGSSLLPAVSQQPVTVGTNQVSTQVTVTQYPPSEMDVSPISINGPTTILTTNNNNSFTSSSEAAFQVQAPIVATSIVTPIAIPNNPTDTTTVSASAVRRLPYALSPSGNAAAATQLNSLFRKATR